MAYIFLSIDGFDKEVCKLINHEVRKLKQEEHRKKWAGVLPKIETFNPRLDLILGLAQYETLESDQLNHCLDDWRARFILEIMYKKEKGLVLPHFSIDTCEITKRIVEHDADNNMSFHVDNEGNKISFDHKSNYRCEVMSLTYMYPDKNIYHEINEIKDWLNMLIGDHDEDAFSESESKSNDSESESEDDF